MSYWCKKSCFLCFLMTTVAFGLSAENGSRLWLRFAETKVQNCRFSGISADKSLVAVSEFQRAWKEMNGTELKFSNNLNNSLLIIGTSENKLIRKLNISKYLKELGNEGFIIRSIKRDGKNLTVVAANTNNGLLYGVFSLLRIIQTNQFFNVTGNHRKTILLHPDAQPLGQFGRNY